jgi:hypothetical protein
MSRQNYAPKYLSPSLALPKGEGNPPALPLPVRFDFGLLNRDQSTLHRQALPEGKETPPISHNSCAFVLP